jgi:L-aminopeptidase/D-esterase-like protein
MSAITSGDSPLTNEEQEALIVALFEPDDDCAHNVAPLFEEVARMVAAARREALLEAHAVIQRHADEADDITPWRLGWKQGCEHGAAMVQQYIDGVRPFAEPERDEEGR